MDEGATRCGKARSIPKESLQASPSDSAAGRLGMHAGAGRAPPSLPPSHSFGSSKLVGALMKIKKPWREAVIFFRGAEEIMSRQ